MSEELIRQALAVQWNISDVLRVTEVKKVASGRMMFRVDTHTRSYALKICAPTRRKQVVEKDIQCLKFLERSRFPACILHDPLHGEGYGMINESYAYVYDWIEGLDAESTVETFEKLGDMMGRLHTIPEPYAFRSDFILKNEVQKLRSAAVAKGIDQKYRDLLSSIRDVDHLPQGMIHTDIGPHNALQRPDGTILIIDWEDAGLGPLIVDIGWELEQCLSDTSVFEIEKAKAFLQAYQAHRKLTLEEINHTYDVALFFAFLYWIDEQKEFGAKRIEWLASNRAQFESVLT